MNNPAYIDTLQKMSEELGKHHIIELEDCDPEMLKDSPVIEKILLDAAKQSGATIINYFFHQFSPHGVSGVIIIAESHISIHTWPDKGYAAIDVFTCSKDMNADSILPYLKKHLSAEKSREIIISRGIS